MKIHSHFRHCSDRKETHHNAPLNKTPKVFLENHSTLKKKKKKKNYLEFPSPQTYLLNPNHFFFSLKCQSQQSFQSMLVFGTAEKKFEF